MSIDIMQKKILKALKPKKVGSHPNVSKKLPKDEYAVGMKDVYKELSYWGALGKFIGKDIICPCDWDIVDGENIYIKEPADKRNPGQAYIFTISSDKGWKTSLTNLPLRKTDSKNVIKM